MTTEMEKNTTSVIFFLKRKKKYFSLGVGRLLRPVRAFPFIVTTLGFTVRGTDVFQSCHDLHPVLLPRLMAWMTSRAVFFI